MIPKPTLTELGIDDSVGHRKPVREYACFDLISGSLPIHSDKRWAALVTLPGVESAGDNLGVKGGKIRAKRVMSFQQSGR